MPTNKPFDLVRQSDLQKITSSELNARELLRDTTIATAFGALAGLRSTAYGGGSNPGIADRAWCALEPGSFLLSGIGTLSLTLSHGLGLCRDNTTDWLAEGRGYYRWLDLAEDVSIGVTPCVTVGNARYDIVVVRPTLHQAEVESVPIKDPVTNTYSGQNRATRFREEIRWGTESQFNAGEADGCVIQGAEATSGTQVEPATPAGAVKLWRYTVSTSTTSNEKDWRRMPRRVPQRLVLDIHYDAGSGTATVMDSEGISLSAYSENGVTGQMTIAFDGGYPTSVPIVRLTAGNDGSAKPMLPFIANDSWRVPLRGVTHQINIRCWDVFNNAVNIATATKFGMEIESVDFDDGVQE